MKSVRLVMLHHLAAAGIVFALQPLGADDVEPAFSVTITATDASTGNPIDSFRVVPAPKGGGVMTTWQSQYLKAFDSPPATFTMQRGWPQMLLRIEADGYRPLVIGPLERQARQTLDVKLEPDAGMTGRVLTPEGQPAEKATLALCTWTNEVTVRDAKLTYSTHGQRLGRIVETTADGSWRLPAEVDEWVIVVAHSSGYAERTAEELATNSDITLRPWGRLEGKYTPGGTAVPGQKFMVSAGRGDVNVNLHYSAGALVVTDSDGTFVVDRLPPVKLYVQPTFEHEENSFSLMWFSGLVQIQPGKTTHVTIPRAGRTLSGQLALPADGSLVPADVEFELSCVLRPPSISGNQEYVAREHAAYAALMQSEQGKHFQRQRIPVGPDGSFRIEGLPETHYVLHARALRKSDSANSARHPVAFHSQRVQVPAATERETIVDLGTLTLRPSAGQ